MTEPDNPQIPNARKEKKEEKNLKSNMKIIF